MKINIILIFAFAFFIFSLSLAVYLDPDTNLDLSYFNTARDWDSWNNDPTTCYLNGISCSEIPGYEEYEKKRIDNINRQKLKEQGYDDTVSEEIGMKEMLEKLERIR